MVVVAILAALVALLFLGAYISKRRFGLLGLALTAGATVSTIWSHEAGLLMAGLGLLPDGPLAHTITLSTVVLLPAIVLLFHGYSYKSKAARAIGSLFFAILALAFLVEPLQYSLVLEGAGAEVFAWVVEYKDLIISIGVIFAVVDLFFTKPAALADKKKH